MPEILAEDQPVVESESVGKGTQCLDAFLQEWDADYAKRITGICLFDANKTCQWTQAQQVYFVKVFYHSRGHFRDLLWHLGNFAPNKRIKSIVLENIEEEFNGDGLSHEQMYLDFARGLGVNLTREILEEENYTPEMREFNASHVKWVLTHSWESSFALFSAYERLDSIDYELLSGLTKPEHMFFRIHRLALHFDKTYEELEKIWEKDANLVREAYEFIAETQARMWRQLSDTIFAYEKSKQTAYHQ